jgi:hypothetical protein
MYTVYTQFARIVENDDEAIQVGAELRGPFKCKLTIKG